MLTRRTDFSTHNVIEDTTFLSDIKCFLPHLKSFLSASKTIKLFSLDSLMSLKETKLEKYCHGDFRKGQNQTTRFQNQKRKRNGEERRVGDICICGPFCLCLFLFPSCVRR